MNSAFLVLLVASNAIAALDAQLEDDISLTEDIRSDNDLINAFTALCAKPFPAKQAFAKAMKSNRFGFTSAPSRNLPHRWVSNNTSLVYADEKMMRANGQPSPQCIVDGVVPMGSDHLTLAKRVESVLRLQTGKSQGRRGVNRTTWNYSDANGNSLRLFFQSKTIGPEQYSLRLTLLRLAPPPRGDKSDATDQQNSNRESAF